MREHYGLDKLSGYSVETIVEPTQVVNPVYRDLDGQVRSQIGKLNRTMASFGAMHFEGTLDDEKLNPFLQKKADLQEEIEQQKTAIEVLKKAMFALIVEKNQDLPTAKQFSIILRCRSINYN